MTLDFGSVQVEEIYVDGELYWKPLIKNAWPENNHWWVSLRERIVKEAIKSRVSKFIFEVSGQEEIYPVPTEKELGKMRKNEQVIEEIINFPNSPMRSYKFCVK